jgi:hypothetical protein
MKLSDLIKQENKENREKLLNSKDYNKNLYYDEKKKRIKEGKEEIYIINEEPTD